MMVKHNVDYIDLPLTKSCLDYASDDNDDIDGKGNCIRIPFDPEEQKQIASQSKPLVANAAELKVAFVIYLKENKPDLLDCQVEKRLKEGWHKRFDDVFFLTREPQ
jgi:hypothetical protein